MLKVVFLTSEPETLWFTGWIPF